MARVLMVREWAYPLDARVRQHVEALLAEGHEVDVLCLRRPGEAWFEHRGRLRVIRLPAFQGRSAPGYLLEYFLFTVLAVLAAAALHVRRRYRLVQVCTLPDLLVVSAALPRLLGARVLLDLREPMPEFFATKFGVGIDHPAARAIGRIEQAAIRFADAALTCTEQMRSAFVGRGAAPARITVVLNSTDPTAFDPTRHGRREDDGEFVIFSHGAIEERYGLDTAIRAVAKVAPDLPGIRLRLHGEGRALPALRQLAADLGVAQRVEFSVGFVPIDEVAAAVARADAGLVAIKRDIFRDLVQCTKMYDFIAMERPVLMSRTSSVSAYFGDGCFAWFDSDDEEDLARAVRALYDDPERRRALAAAASRTAEPYQWQSQRDIYLKAVQGLLSR